MTTTGAPAAATSRTTSNAWLVRNPLASAVSAASWMVGPSMTGSLYGRPISTRSQPPSIMAVNAATDVSTSGKPAGR